MGHKKVTDMSGMFYGCNNLSSLPDISKWDTENVTEKSHMFYGCSLLSSLPDISHWNIKKVDKMVSMFCHCESLSSFPDISKWDIKNINSKGMFNFYSSLVKLSLNYDQSKVNICFFLDNLNLVCDYGTTINEVLKKFYERRSYYRTKFMYNGKTLNFNFNDNTPL